MPASLLFHLLATATLLPAAAIAVRRGTVPWAAVAIAVAGAVVWTVVLARGPWPAGFSAALWLTIATTLALGAGFALADPRMRGLAVLLFPYLTVLGLLASALSQVPTAAPADTSHFGWFAVHVLFAVGTYALVTLAALAALAVLLQERALKARRPAALTRLLPPMADAEALEFRLLMAGEVVLGLGLASGLATELVQRGTATALDHKIVLSAAAFVAIAAVLLLHARSGMRGRRAAEWVLAGYLLLTLAYPGVKFVRDVLIG